jgi:hypothetical protein
MKWRNRVCSSIAIGGMLVLSGCDGAIKVEGKVYARRTAGAESQASVDEPANTEPGLSPLEGVRITVYHGEDYASKPIDKSTQYQTSTTTNSLGEFSTVATTAPFKFHAALTAEKEGYKAVTKVFLHDKLDHKAVIVLVPAERINQ